MGFFAEELSENSGVSIPIPEGHHLQITHVCLDLDQESTGPVILRAKSTNDEQEFNICILHAASHRYHEQLNLEFGVEDSPVEFSVDGGTVHLTGNWRWDDDHEHGDECGGDEDEDDEEEEEEEEEDEEADMDEDEVPELVPFPDEDEDESTVEEVQKKSKGDKKKAAQPEKKSSKTESEEAPAKGADDKSNKKKRQAEAVAEKKDQPPAKKAATATAASKDTTVRFNLPHWHVIPETDSGILVPVPKMVTKKDGLIITDHIIGKGALPKPGAFVEILYEGLFPETGETFDHRLRRKQPFTFRRGLQHVIKGMDLGMEGMRVGGAREIIIPPNLGYGAKGVGDIPGNQTLVFRIQLIGTH